MKLWDKGYTVNNLVEKYTVGKDRELDLHLAPYDVQGNIAHAKMLHKIGILSQEELDDLLRGLAEIQSEIEAGTFEIEAQFEDVHSKIEFALVEKIGEAGKKIHTARSRNDQVLVDLHLYTKDQLQGIREQVVRLFEALLEAAARHQDHLMPGYTHLQVAMPSSYGLWFGAYAESLIDDVAMLNAALHIADQNPLGSAAGYGSSFPIDRELTTELLGFQTMKYNVVAAQLSRGKLERLTGYALASLAATLGKFASDVCLFMSQNFDLISLPKELTTGSSIMPHKQNPDVFELMRARCNKISNLPAEVSLITTNLTHGYHRDFQLLKENLIEAIRSTQDNLEVAAFVIPHIRINENVLDNPIYDYLYSVEEVNRRVLEGMSFREAYRQLGEEIMQGNFQPEKAIRHTHAGSIGNLCLHEIRQKMQRLI